MRVSYIARWVSLISILSTHILPWLFQKTYDQPSFSRRASNRPSKETCGISVWISLATMSILFETIKEDGAAQASVFTAMNRINAIDFVFILVRTSAASNHRSRRRTVVGRYCLFWMDGRNGRPALKPARPPVPPSVRGGVLEIAGASPTFFRAVALAGAAYLSSRHQACPGRGTVPGLCQRRHP